MEQAELGDLSARARQAVVLTRADASPVQVAAADRVLRDHPLGGPGLFTDVDPTAAATAAAHWLHAAATVAAEAAGNEVAGIIAEADDIEALPVVTPTVVLTMMEDGATPHEAVTTLVRGAMAVGEGRVPNSLGLVHTLAQLTEQAEELAPGDGDAMASALASVRSTPLDPARPAFDLLEDLLAVNRTLVSSLIQRISIHWIGVPHYSRTHRSALIASTSQRDSDRKTSDAVDL